MAKEENKNQFMETADSFADMVEAFGSAVAQIFKDPALKDKAKEFGKSASDSAKTFSQRFSDEDVKDKFSNVGSAAKEFGEQVSELFEEKKKNPENKEE